MGWIEIIIVAIVALAVGLYALLGVAIIVTALVERRPIRPLVPAPADDPEWHKLGAVGPGMMPLQSREPDANPYAAPGPVSYAEAQIRAAAELAFAAPQLFKHAKGGIYQTHVALTVSATGQILAVIRWGTTASIRNEVTLLYSTLEDGGYLVTSDRPTGARTPGFYDDQVYLGATLAQLVRRHEERMRASRKEFKTLSGENLLEQYEEIMARRAQFLIERGEAKWADAGQTAFRSTLKGALKTYARTFSTKHVDQSLRMPGGRKS
jgi:hypothetical protein